ncbi:MAG: Veg family protein [Corallococcus sp.]|nr:Veg family protein [Corallococcus sp.]MCM1359894.1 Veg family protein [Corallococcus sp.]MCM1395328.1 Veg family protein [Corallococcus sp.]
MKKGANLDDIKAKVGLLVGKPVSVRLNRGRNRVKNYRGVLTEVHGNVFVVTLSGATVIDRISCSYTDMLCGEVTISEQRAALE